MRKLVLSLLWMLPYLSLAQPLGGRLVLLAGVQGNSFYSTDDVEGPSPSYRRTANAGSLIEMNYAFLQKRNQELFGGFRWSQGVFDRHEVPIANGGIVDYRNRISVYQTVEAQIGYRQWLPGKMKAQFAFETGLLLAHNNLSGYIPNNPNYVYDVMPIRPAFRLGNVLRRGWLVCSSSLTWQPFPAYFRTFNWENTGNPSRPTTSGRTRLGYKSFQFGFVVGLRL